MKSEQPKDVQNTSKLPSTSTLRHIVEIEARHKLAISLAIGILISGFTWRYVSLPLCIITGWDAFALSSLTLAWLGMFFTDAQTRAREAHLQDSSHSIILFCMLLASIAGLAGAGVLLGTAKGLSTLEATQHVSLAGLTVLSSWFLVHTMMSIHYAHLFYCSCKETDSARGAGLTFPKENSPDFLDFAYFSFVIGMTFQVSDVQITSRRIRRVVLVHSLLSFVYNTIILALSINLAASLA